MASWIAGAGNAGPSGKGVAPGAGILSSSFVGLLPDSDADYDRFDVSVQNHSYGVDIENYYGANALAYDVSANGHPELLHVFSSGNSGNSASASGTYAGLAGFANLTGNFKMAKNVLTVGSVNKFSQLMPFSSRGPAYDGRIKPELVAFGQDGSSGSAALVSGAAALIRQAFLQRFGRPPGSDMLKAILTASAEDIGPRGPDFFSGFGKLNLLEAVRLVQHQWLQKDTVRAGETKNLSLELPAGIRELRISLCWTDPPASPNAPKALVHDLDLELRAPDGSIWRPWILNSHPHPDSLAKPALRGRDSLNNLEQITLELPASGSYQLRVSGLNLVSGDQDFALAAHWREDDRFEWIYPLAGDPAEAGEKLVLRWTSTLAEDSAVLEWKPVDELNWRPIGDRVLLSGGLAEWQLPDTFCAAQLRVRGLRFAYPTEIFLIAPYPKLNVAFNCKDSLLLTWDPVSPDAVYHLWGLGERYLEPLLRTTDTALVLQKAAFPNTRFALSMDIRSDAASAPPGFAPDPSSQGVTCYFRSFLGQLQDDSARVDLRLSLGAVYGIRKVIIRKWTMGSWLPFREQPPGDQLQFFFRDEHIQTGANSYRAFLELENGAILEGETLTLWYAGKTGAVLLPNPARGNGVLSVVITATGQVPIFSLYDLSGRSVLDRHLEDSKTDISLPGLAPGFYFWIIRSGTGQKLADGSLSVTGP